MVEALIALVLAVFLLLVFNVGWAGKVIAIGGFGFFLYVCILVVRWLFGKWKS